MTRKIIVEVISSLLVLLFLYTSLSKWLDFKTFTGEMNNQPFPNWMTPWLVWILPVTEVLIVLALLFEKTRLTGLWASFVLMILFTIYTALVLLRVFHRVPCSCGGVIKNLNWKQHLVFNLFFTGISIAAILLKRGELRNKTAKEHILV
jgi:putative oxidoreductase